jgi:hypothetical protein
MVPNFLHVMWSGVAFHWLRVQNFENLILVIALFPPDGGKRRKERRKKIGMGKEGFPRAGPALLAVQWIAAVRCN